MLYCSAKPIAYFKLDVIKTVSVCPEKKRGSSWWMATVYSTIVCVGNPLVMSLKTRLQSLQVLGAIMSGMSDKSLEAQVKCQKVKKIQYYMKGT